MKKGPSAFDRRHRAVFTWIYQTPALKSSSALARAVSWPVRDWQISGIFTVQTGAPETVYIGSYDQNGDLNAANDRPNLSNPNAPINYSSACVKSKTCISGVGQINADGTLSDWNTGAPGTASQFRYIATNGVGRGPNGNLGRNTFYNPGRQDYERHLRESSSFPTLKPMSSNSERKLSTCSTTRMRAAARRRMAPAFRESAATSMGLRS